MNQKQNQDDLTKSVIDGIEYKGDDEIISWEEVRESSKNEDQGKEVVSQIPSLDKAIKCFEPGELIALSGPRKSGKTLLAQTLDRSFWKQGYRSLWLQYELTPKQFVNTFSDNVKLDMSYTPKRMKAHLLSWARDKITEALGKHGISIVFIDHIHFLFDMGKVRNASLEIGQVVRYLKYLAVELNLIIFILCHMRKTDLEKEPTDEDFRDSSLIAQESDVGMIIWRVKNSDDQAWLKVCYSRKTGTWEKKIKMIKTQHGLLAEKFDE